MPFLSALLNRPVRDGRGEVVGKCKDVYVDPVEGFPAVVAIGLRRQNQEFLVAAVDLLAAGREAALCCASGCATWPCTSRAATKSALGKQVMDRQIIDVHGRRVVRVHDLQLARINGHYRLVGIDATPRAMLRRLGLEGPTAGVLRLVGMGRALGDGCIPWNQLDPVAIGPAGIPLKTDHTALGRMHPADLADIVEQLDQTAGGYLLSSLDAETAADTLQEVEPESQASLMEQLDTERAADILERMPPDEAADLLADLPEHRAAELLAHMEPVEAADVRELLAYPEDSAGGRMTTDYLTIAPELTAMQTIERMRAEAGGREPVYLRHRARRAPGRRDFAARPDRGPARQGDPRVHDHPGDQRRRRYATGRGRGRAHQVRLARGARRGRREEDAGHRHGGRRARRPAARRVAQEPAPHLLTRPA